MSAPPSHTSQAGKRRKKYKPLQPPLWGAFFLRFSEGLRRAPPEEDWWFLLKDNSIMNYELLIIYPVPKRGSWCIGHTPRSAPNTGLDRDKYSKYSLPILRAY